MGLLKLLHPARLLMGGLCLAAAGSAFAQTITGTAMYSERIALPPNAVFEAVLEDVSRAGAPAVVLGRHVLEPAGRPPFKFSIPYNPAGIQPQMRYGVRGRVLLDGRLLFITDTFNQVLKTPQDTDVQVVLRQVAADPVAPPAATAPLQDTYWKLVRLGSEAVSPPAGQNREAHLVLHTQGRRLAGSGGCNRLMGSYALEGGKLSFPPAATTRMACPEAGDAEGRFLKALTQVAGYRLSGQQLVLLDAGGRALAQLEAVALR
jgi:putative lipoprotein